MVRRKLVCQSTQMQQLPEDYPNSSCRFGGTKVDGQFTLFKESYENVLLKDR